MRKKIPTLCLLISCAANSRDMPFFPLDSGNTTVYQMFACRLPSSADNSPVCDSFVRKYSDYRVIDSTDFVRTVQDNNEPPMVDSCEILRNSIYCGHGTYEIGYDYANGGDVRVSRFQVGSDSFFLYEYSHTSPSLARSKIVNFYQSGVGLVYGYNSKTVIGLSDEIQSSDESILISFRGNAIDGKTIYNSVMQSTSLSDAQKRIDRRRGNSFDKPNSLRMLNGMNDALGRIIR